MSLIVYTGPMCAGKTRELLRKLECATLAGLRVLGVSSTVDTRSTETFSSRSSEPIPHLTSLKVRNLAEVDVSDFDTIGVDEGQFFPDLAEVVPLWADSGKHVIVSGLNGTFERKTFGSMSDLLPFADEFHLLTAVCTVCARDKNLTPAIFSVRKGKSRDTIVVGGDDDYMPVCRTHYLVRT